MPAGIEVEVADGFARVSFPDASLRGPSLTALLQEGGPGLVDTDTSGRRFAYVVPESVARAAGLLDAPKRRRKAESKRESGGQAPARESTTVTGDGLTVEET